MTDPKHRILSSFERQGLMATFGARLVSVADGEVQIELPFTATLSQQHGYLHAGAVSSVAQTRARSSGRTDRMAVCDPMRVPANQLCRRRTGHAKK